MEQLELGSPNICLNFSPYVVNRYFGLYMYLLVRHAGSRFPPVVLPSGPASSAKHAGPSTITWPEIPSPRMAFRN